MTADQAAAIERLRSAHQLRMAYPGMTNDYIVAAHLFLAEHPADDCEPLTEEWFVSLRWSEHSLYFSTLIDHPTPIELRIGPPEDDGTWTVALNQAAAPDNQSRDDCVCLLPVRTRGDVRRLCRALQIPRRER